MLHDGCVHCGCLADHADGCVFHVARPADVAEAKKYTIRCSTWRDGIPVDIDEFIGRVDDYHAEPLRVLEPGEEREIPLLGQPSWFVRRES